MYDCVVIGGGIAGLQTAIQLGRYRWRVLVLDSNDGRSTLCQSYRNLLGWPDGVSGLELRRLGRLHALKMGVTFENHTAVSAKRDANGFSIRIGHGPNVLGKTMLLATGVKDNIPPIPGIGMHLGRTLFVCPDCDGYECRDQRTVIIGQDQAGANLALTLLHWTPHITFINHLGQSLNDKTRDDLKRAKIRYIEGEIQHLENAMDGTLGRVVLTTGELVEADKGFVAFGGNQVMSSLASEIGVHCVNRHVVVHPRTKMTSVKGLWAAGDLVAHSEQVSIAMGDGSQAAIFIHKYLRGEDVEPYTSIDP